MGWFWKSKVENEAKLTKCLNCGGKVSSQASQCPHCNIKYPNGIRCDICCKKGMLSEGREEVWDEGYSTWMHTTCYIKLRRELESIKYICPVCKHTQMCEITTNIGVSGYYPRIKGPCPKCGHHIQGGYRSERCMYCKVYLLPVGAVRASGGYAHKACYKAWVGR